MKKEYIFITTLLVIAVVLFGFGSQAGVGLQTALRGGTNAYAPSGTDLASIGQIFGVNGVSGTSNANGVIGARSNGASTTIPGIAVAVYSQYPFNLKNELSIAAGSGDGIAVGDAALANGFFIGTVQKTFAHSAVVQTIFDSAFQAPVRIGTAGADALLKGGNDPALTLIAADAAVSEGDEVYTAQSGVPYGIAIGALHNLHDAGDKVFREASLVAPYDPAGLSALTIIPSPADQ